MPVEEYWYAVHTYPRHEGVMAGRVEQHGFTTFLPTVKELHRWSDRRKVVELPLFSSYVFVQLEPTNKERVRVLRSDGVISLVGSQGRGTPIPAEQIAAVRTLLDRDIVCAAYPFLKVEQRVRIRGGALDGVEGGFLSQNRDRSLVISVDAIQRSLALRINGYDMSPNRRFRLPSVSVQFLTLAAKRRARSIRLCNKYAFAIQCAGCGRFHVVHREP